MGIMARGIGVAIAIGAAAIIGPGGGAATFIMAGRSSTMSTGLATIGASITLIGIMLTVRGGIVIFGRPLPVDFPPEPVPPVPVVAAAAGAGALLMSLRNSP